jgi:hypothetical protein
MAKYCFADNLYLNVMPRKKESINGSDYIANHQELSDALKQCARLKKQFLDYFLDGTLVGNCILSQECAGAHIAAYVLPDRVLMILVNQGGKQSIGFDCDLAPWIPSKSGGYTAKSYDGNGAPTSTTDIKALWHGETRILEPQEMVIYEFSAD